MHLYGPGDGLRLRANALAALVYWVWLSIGAAALLLARAWRRSPSEVRTVVVTVIVMQLIMNLTMLRDPMETRIRDVFVSTAILTAYLAGCAWHAAAQSRRVWGLRVVATAMLMLIVCAAGSFGEASLRLARTGAPGGIDGRRTFSPPDHRTGPLGPAYQPVVAYLKKCTRPESRVLTLTFAPELFFYSGRGFAGG